MRKMICAAAMILTLASCAEADKSPEVATLRSASPAKSAVPKHERPVIPADGGMDAYAKYAEIWGACLNQEGVPGDGKPEGSPSDPRYKAAFEKCADKEPEFWIDREARTNPEYADHLRVAVKCLKEKGYHAGLSGGTPPEITYSSNGERIDAINDRDQCLREAFADRLKLYK